MPNLYVIKIRGGIGQGTEYVDALDGIAYSPTFARKFSTIPDLESFASNLIHRLGLKKFAYVAEPMDPEKLAGQADELHRQREVYRKAKVS